MFKHVLAAVLAAALLSIPAAPVDAATAEKKLTPQQQKMKDCAGKWGGYKKEKNVKGRVEYRKFMSTCLKG
jgi:hypothetical protein